MAKKKTSETLAEQRKARQEFLELKKIQNGEMDAGPKPSEQATELVTFGQKLSNFWFHNKWQTLGIAAALVALVLLVSQCAARTNFDIQVVYFSYTPVIDQQTELVADYLETIADDVNGDGEVHIQVINCSVPDNGVSTRYSTTVLSKMQSLIAGEEKAMLFITDQKSIEYFKNDTIKELFSDDPVLFGKDFYQKTRLEGFDALPDGLQISCRRVAGTIIDKKPHVAAIYKESQEILKKIAATD